MKNWNIFYVDIYISIHKVTYSGELVMPYTILVITLYMNLRERYDQMKECRVQEPNYEICLNLIFVVSPYENVTIFPDTNYTTSAIRKVMMDMPIPGSFQNTGLSMIPTWLRA